MRDLLAMVAVGTALAAIFTHWLGVSGRTRDAILCLTNGRQMMRAVALYADDHDGLLPPNEDALFAGHNWLAAHASILPDATNQVALGDPQINLLAPYAPSPKIWRCPADRSTVVAGGARVRRVRSVSMNCAVGTVCISWPAGHQGAPLLPTHGSWLDGWYSHRRETKFRTFGRQSDFVLPAETFVFIDEHPPSINDGLFAQPGYSPSDPTLSRIFWVDFPATYHGRAAGITFADGHAEIRRWRALRDTGGVLGGSRVQPQHRMDWEWLATRATQPLQ